MTGTSMLHHVLQTKKSSSLCYFDTYFIHNIGGVSDRRWHNSFSLQYIDKETCHRLSETSSILYIKHLSKYRSKSDLLALQCLLNNIQCCRKMNIYICIKLLLVNDMQTPSLKSGQIRFLVTKDAKCSEIYAKTIFRYFLNIFVQQNFHFMFLGLKKRFFDKKFSFASMLLSIRSK